jgi:hypothetical protein
MDIKTCHSDFLPSTESSNGDVVNEKLHVHLGIFAKMYNKFHVTKPKIILLLECMHLCKYPL